jgi:LacI family transcriptional regulator, fructose operon transcriptional repressor
MASIKEVAEAAGVSTATVSRVFSNKPHVRAEVRERVMAAVEQLAYRPNRAARTLRSQQSNTIGLIVSDIRNPFFTAISRSVEDTAYEHGYSVLLCNTDEDPDKEKLYLKLMQDENVAGIIFSPTRQALAHFADMKIDFPTVLVDRSLKNGDVDAVLLDNVTAAYELTLHLIEQGYQQIGIILGAVGTTGEERRRGYEDALRDHGIVARTELIKDAQPKIESGRTATLELLELAHPPDAIFASNNLLTAGALQAIRERDLRIPHDIALVGFDEMVWAALVEPALTVMAQPTDDIGRTATELLLQRLANPNRPPRKVILQGQLRVRGSSARR